MSMILLEPAYKILHTTVKFKRRTISVSPFWRELQGQYRGQCYQYASGPGGKRRTGTSPARRLR